jgi:signal transduction histidine kinase
MRASYRAQYLVHAILPAETACPQSQDSNAPARWSVRGVMHTNEVRELIITHTSGAADECAGRKPRQRQRVEAAIRQHTADSALGTSLRVTGPLSVVDGELADHAEAVVREAVSNAARHAQASTIDIEIAVADHLAVTVTDDGCGIPENITPSGLTNLARRAESVGGQFSVLPGPADDTGKCLGTRLRWSAPLA